MRTPAAELKRVLVESETCLAVGRSLVAQLRPTLFEGDPMGKRRLQKAEADYLVLGIAYGSAMDVYNIVCGLPVENSNRVEELTREVNEAFAGLSQDDAEEIALHKVQEAYDEMVFAARWYNRCLPRGERLPDSVIGEALSRH